MHIQLGIIAVPAEAAQGVANQLLEAGIAAIWNFAPVPLKVPPTIILQNTELSAELAVLSVMLSAMRRKRPSGEVLGPLSPQPPSSPEESSGNTL
jgi:redox-sensing transcriptional repressor